MAEPAAGLVVGAVCYRTKPFSHPVLLARLRALARREAGGTHCRRPHPRSGQLHRLRDGVRSVGGDINAQVEEVSDVHWVPLTSLADLSTPAELPALVHAAATWARNH